MPTTIIVFAVPPLARQRPKLVRSAPEVWQGIRIRIKSLTRNYPTVRDALPRTDEIASKVGGAAGTVGNILLRSTLGLVGGMASVVNHHQLGTWPHTVEFPGVCNGGLKVKATIHQDPGNADQDIGVAK